METATRIRTCRSCTESETLLPGLGYFSGFSGKVGIIENPHACDESCQCGCHPLWREITNKEVTK